MVADPAANDVHRETANMKRLLISLTAVAGLAATQAFASTVDFTTGSAATSGGTGVGGITYTLSASTGSVNIVNEAVQGGDCALLSDLACETDGVGINNDEISGVGIESGQILTVDFSDPVQITALFLLDLFGDETAFVSFDGGAYSLFASQGNAGGFAVIDSGLPVGPVTSIAFTAFNGEDCTFCDDRDNDYALAGFSVASVPAPGTLMLLGIGLAGLGLVRRKQS